MKILINTAHQRFGGAIQVALSIINECRNFPENDYFVFVGPGIKKILNENDFPSNFYFYHFNFGLINFWKTLIINSKLKKLEEKIKPDCVIATSGPTYFKSTAPQIIGFNLPLYIYPESPYTINLSFFNKIKLKIKKFVHFYYFKRDASALIVQSDDVKMRVKKALKTDNIFTITNTANGFFVNWKKFPKKLPERKNSELRFITISAYYPHKNLEIIPKISDILKSKGIYNLKFITTLKRTDFYKYVNPNNDDCLINVGPVEPEECPSLYDECDLLFQPSLAECFSASYPEAMIMKKPIITTDISFAKSICGDAALYYNPINPTDAADKIELLIFDKNLQKKLITNGLKQFKKFDTPFSRAEKFLKLCENISKNE